MVMMLLIMELWVGPTLAAANHCLALLHIFRAPPAQLVLRDPPCSILILKATAIHLFLLIATPSIHHGFSFPIRNQNCQLLTVQVRLAKYFFFKLPQPFISLLSCLYSSCSSDVPLYL